MISVLSALLIPICVVVYSMLNMGIGSTPAGVLDHTVFISISFILYYLILRIPSFISRIIVSFTFVLFLTLFFIFNSLNYRFFHTWGQMDALKQWEDLMSIWTALIVLLRWQDLVFGILVPFFFWQLSLMNSFIIHRWIIRLLLIGCMAFITMSAIYTPDVVVYSAHNPLFYVMRQKIFNLQLRLKANNLSDHHTMDPACFVLTNSTLYKRTGNPKFPLEEVPLENRKPLPFAISGKPNVVVIILESVRAFECGAYGSQPSFTPNLDKLQKEGIIFKNFYANGCQTIRGEFAIHSSYIPNMSGASVYIDKPDLSIVTLSMVLKNNGYKTLWIGSHPPTYDKKIKFLSHHGIDEFKYKVPVVHKSMGWGPPDEDMFDYAFNTLKQTERPFFAEIMTLSNHFPFDEKTSPTRTQCPMVQGSDLYRGYTQGVYYTDYALGTFIEKVRNSKLFENTVILITGDHGIWLYPDSKETKDMVARQEIYFRSPCIIWSPKLLKPQTVTSIGSHVDIAPTILDLLNIHRKNYFMGTSLLRDDVGNRYVFTIQDNRWNLRLGNQYAYDTGPEDFVNIQSQNLTMLKNNFQNLLPSNMFKKSSDVSRHYFSADQDLLHEAYTLLPLSDDKSKELDNFAREGIDFLQSLMFSNRIAPQGEGLTALSEGITQEERNFIKHD